MKNLLTKRKKGFTLTELAVVIAVIAILIAVLVPTFTSLLSSAKKTADLEECKNAYTQLLTQDDYVGNPEKVAYAVFVGSNDYCYMADENGSFDSDNCYKINVMSKTGSSSYLDTDKCSICIPAGDTMYIITGSTPPQNMNYYTVEEVENTYVLVYNVTEGGTTLFSALSGMYIIFDGNVVCEVQNNVLVGYTISSGSVTDQNYYTVNTSGNDGYCSISSASQGDNGALYCMEIPSTVVSNYLNITGVSFYIIGEANKLTALYSQLTGSGI